MKAKSRSLLLLIVCLISIAALAGCATRHTEVVYSSLRPFPEALDSVIIIATNKPIRVTVGDSVAKKDLGGYVAVHVNDIEALVDESELLRKQLRDAANGE